ncbi:MAG: hypothetical protein JRD47_07645 [Deltaproteobacteria bacterium]|jgi:hypothetical protein|nr:hypothetical protein [Deltaproteobacteria bacterium]MBW2601781.1 hypothetical protein [Deltaproteobacteria bacterium]
MKPNANPLPKSGERNALCHYYEGCLDHAIERRWRFWDCSLCPHRSKKMSLGDAPMVKDPNPEYHIVSESFRQLVAF